MEVQEDLYPNLYRVTFEKITDDKTETHVVFIEDITYLKHYMDTAIEIVPVSAIYLPPLTDDGIESLIELVLIKEAQDADLQLAQDIKIAEDNLAKLKGKVK